MFVVTGITGKVGAAVARSPHIAAASLLVFGLAGAGAQASHAVDHSQGYKAMSMKYDLAHRSRGPVDGGTRRSRILRVLSEERSLALSGLASGKHQSLCHSCDCRSLAK